MRGPEFYVEDRVLEGFWANRHSIIEALTGLGFNPILGPTITVWNEHSRLMPAPVVDRLRAHVEVGGDSCD